VLVLAPELYELLEHTADAAYSVTDDGTVCSWNGAAATLFGYVPDDAIGQNIDRLLDARDDLGTRALAGGPAAATRHHGNAAAGIPNFDLDVRIASGRRIWINVSTIVFENSRSGQRLFVRLARDITLRKERDVAQERLLASARQLVALAEARADHAPVEALSVQERRILKLFAAGRTATAIARTLRISPQTLRNHLHHINRKLRTHSRLEAVTHAQQRGLLDA
jgi:PAS domain S-box-containing protein